MRMLDQVPVKPNDRTAVQRAAEILHRQFPVERVILFGSKARGDDDAESDIDLLVLTSRPLGGAERDAVVGALFDLQLELGVVLSPLVLPANEWDQGLYQALPLWQEVQRDGVLA